MTCKYISSKGKGCNIKKVDDKYGICNKHLQIYLNKIEKESNTDTKIEKKKIRKEEKVIENKSKYNRKENNEIDELLESEIESDIEMETENYSEEENEENNENNENKEINLSKENKDFQLSIIKMGYNFCTNIMESISPEYLKNFSKQCSEDPNINKCLEEINDKRNFEIIKNCSPENKLLFFTGMIAIGKATQGYAKDIRKIEPQKRDEIQVDIKLDEYEDL
jgi:hypothetical protein